MKQAHIFGYTKGFLGLKIPYDPQLLAMIRSMPQRQWEPGSKTWLLPDNQASADQLLRALWDTGIFTHKEEPEEVQKEPLTTWQRQMSETLTAGHYSPRTISTYTEWNQRFANFIKKPLDKTLTATEINAFVTHLAVHDDVSASTQNQALAAVLFLYRQVFKIPVHDLGPIVRAKNRRKIPVVLTKDEINRVLKNLNGEKWLAVKLMYGTGLRLMECLNLRVQDLDFQRHEIQVHSGKGAKDRVTV